MSWALFPNFYSSYIWDAAPLSSGQKYQLALRSIADPFTFVGTAMFAAAEQWQNTFPGYGQGAQGYAKRYGAAYADEAHQPHDRQRHTAIPSASRPALFLSR